MSYVPNTFEGERATGEKFVNKDAYDESKKEKKWSPTNSESEKRCITKDMSIRRKAYTEHNRERLEYIQGHLSGSHGLVIYKIA
jgi:hypothetical protein